DLVVAEYGQFYPLLNLLPLLAGGRPRLLVDYHGVTPPELWGLQNREALDQGLRQRGLLWCADAVLAHSRYIQRELAEQCGIPPVEAMACGVPVVAARTTALPETLAAAGLSFAPDDAADLERQLRRILVGRGAWGVGREETALGHGQETVPPGPTAGLLRPKN